MHGPLPNRCASFFALLTCTANHTASLACTCIGFRNARNCGCRCVRCVEHSACASSVCALPCAAASAVRCVLVLRQCLDHHGWWTQAHSCQQHHQWQHQKQQHQQAASLLLTPRPSPPSPGLLSPPLPLLSLTPHAPAPRHVPRYMARTVQVR